MQVKIGRNGKLYVEKYVKYFYNFIKKLYINVQYYEPNKEIQVSALINFITTKCDERLHTIYIVGDIELVRLGKEIEKSLRNVELVQFGKRSAGHRDEAIFLKYCPKLTTLMLFGKIQGSSVDAIFQQQYSQLTSFVHYGDFVLSFCADTLKTFFQKNDKIEFVRWEFSFCAGGKRRNFRAVEYIKALNYAVNLKHLCLTVGGSVTNCFHAICNHLNVLYERGICKSLEIDFEFHAGAQLLMVHANQLASIKQLTKIHLTTLELASVMSALRSFVHLKFIVIRCIFMEDRWSNWTDLDELIGEVDNEKNMELPQVEEIQLFQMCSDKELSALIMLFARHWTNLKRLLVDDRIVARFCIPEFNRARGKLIDACELTIFTNNKSYATNLDYKLVKLKFLKFQFNHYPEYAF